MDEMPKSVASHDHLLRCVWVLREQADQVIEARDFEAAASMLENAASLCWILQKRISVD